MVYWGGFIEYNRNTNIDFLLHYELLGYSKDYGYDNGCRIWFRIIGLTGDEGLRKYSMIKM